VHRLPGKTMRQNTTTREKLPQADAPAPLREPSAPGTVGRQRPKRKRNVMPRRKRPVGPPAALNLPAGLRGQRQEDAGALRQLQPPHTLLRTPLPRVLMLAGMWAFDSASSRGASLNTGSPAAPQGELLKSGMAPVGGPPEPCLHSPEAAPGFSGCRARAPRPCRCLFCEISPGTVMIFLQDGAIQAEMLPTVPPGHCGCPQAHPGASQSR